MDDALLQAGILITPPNLQEDDYLKLSAELVRYRQVHPDKELILRVTGWGGILELALGLYDLIRADGNIRGELVGSAWSGHTILFCACKTRVVYPNATLKVHGCARNADRIDADTIQYHLDMLEKLNWQLAEVYADACTAVPYSSKFHWKPKLNENTEKFTTFFAQDLVKMGMAVLHE